MSTLHIMIQRKLRLDTASPPKLYQFRSGDFSRPLQISTGEWKAEKKNN